MNKNHNLLKHVLGLICTFAK